MAEVNFNQIKYLSDSGLKKLWEKISDTFLRDSEVLDALTTYGEGKIIVNERDTFVQTGKFTDTTTALSQRIEDVAAAQGTNIDNKTIVNVEGKLQTNLILHNDKDNHVLSIVANGVEGEDGIISSWNYSEFYEEAVKDGILDSVSLVVVPTETDPVADGRPAGTYLKFVFNTSSGKDPIYVNVTDLIDVYTGSTYIKVVKTGDTSEISIDTAKLVDYLKTDDALGITSILSRLEGHDDSIVSVNDAITALQKAFDNLDIEGLKDQIKQNTSDIADIVEVLKTVPNTPITDDEIDALV